MKVNYSDQDVLKGSKSIFLAGPTPRRIDVDTWRNEAIDILHNLNFNGIVYVPEKEFDDRTFNYDNQVWWERDALYTADIIVFWIPRNLKTLPGFTTNVEFGYWLAKNSQKVIYGRNDDSQKNKYLDWLYKTETGRQPINSLNRLMEYAVSLFDKDYNHLDINKTLSKKL